MASIIHMLAKRLRRYCRPQLPNRRCGMWSRHDIPMASRTVSSRPHDRPGGEPGVAGVAERKRTRAHIIDLEGDLPDVGSPDLVLFLDVLEHLRRPENVLARLTEKMSVGGVVLVSVPDVAHLVSFPLLFRAAFDYQDAGILIAPIFGFSFGNPRSSCSTRPVLPLSRASGWFFRPSDRLIDKMTLGSMRDHLTKQYVMCGIRTGS